MKKNTLSIEINKPVEVVFKATINPQNTPKWIPSILEEKTFEPNVKIGTIFSQKVKNGNNKPIETALVITGFIENKQLDFHLVNGNYTCTYRYEPTKNGTKLTYSEENGVEGKLDSLMTKENLQMLKKLIEK